MSGKLYRMCEGRCCLILVMIVVTARGMPVSPGGLPVDFSGLDLRDLPWHRQPTPAAECTRTQCDATETQLCRNKGVCVITNKCAFKCVCQNGYTGHFCGRNVTGSATDTSSAFDPLARAIEQMIKGSKLASTTVTTSATTVTAKPTTTSTTTVTAMSTTTTTTTTTTVIDVHPTSTMAQVS